MSNEHVMCEATHLIQVKTIICLPIVASLASLIGYYLIFISFFYANFNLQFFTWVWVATSLFRSSGLFLALLWFEWSQLSLWSPVHTVSYQCTCELFQGIWLWLVSLLPTYSNTYFSFLARSRYLLNYNYYYYY